MKKLIKPRGGGREGRTLFTAAGSIENLADSNEFSSDTQTPKPGENSPTQTQISTQPVFFRLTNTEASADWFSQRCTQAMKGGCRDAYKSSHDYWVWSALITLSSPQICACKEAGLTEATLFLQTPRWKKMICEVLFAFDEFTDIKKKIRQTFSKLSYKISPAFLSVYIYHLIKLLSREIYFVGSKKPLHAPVVFIEWR